MSADLSRISSLRPFLWPVPLILAAWVTSLWWERGISYDDGGLGTASFLVVYTMGYVGTLFGNVVSPSLSDGLAAGSPLGHSYWLFCGLVACLPYLIADSMLQRMVARRARTPADSSDT